jgi:site-specific recombinase XerD
MMKDYYQKSINALQLAGMSSRTQECYTRSVLKLVNFYNKTPDLISEKELEDYFLHRRNVDQWAPATLRIAYSGIKFFFINVLKKDWHIFTYLNAKRSKALPCVLSREEIDQIFKQGETFHNYTYLSTVYSCGLRLQEALYLFYPGSDPCKLVAPYFL